MSHHRRHGCGPRGSVEICLPEGLLAMRGSHGWRGSWGPFSFDFGDEGWGGARADAAAAACSSAASFAWCC